MRPDSLVVQCTEGLFVDETEIPPDSANFRHSLALCFVNVGGCGQIISYPEAYVFFSRDSRDHCAINRVRQFWIVFPNVHDF